MATERCVGCGAVVPAIEGPVHRYMTSAPGCWAMFGELCARLLRDPLDTPGRQLCFDAYAVQHPGSRGPQAIQSVAGHLVSLYSQLVRGDSAAHAHVLIERATQNERELHWLAPPSFAGALTVAHVLPQIEIPYSAGVEWATSAWQAWAPHHAQVRLWYDVLSRLE